MNKKILIVNSNYYNVISNHLIIDAKKTLDKYKIKYKIVNVPGVFEIPVIISKNIKKYDGFIALGCVIKGETPHFNFISKSAINALMKLSIESKRVASLKSLTAKSKSSSKIACQPLAI